MKSTLLTLVCIGLLASCSSGGGDDREAKNIQRTMEFYDQVFNTHNLALVDSFATPDFILNLPPGMYPPGVEGLRAALGDQFSAFPDIKATVNFAVASGDTVVVHYTMTGTNTGSYMGMPPTGKSFSADGVDIVIVSENGRQASEVKSYLEEMKMMTQLGFMPEPGAPADSAGMAPTEPME
jgi:predicted ester cyclase